MVVAGVDGAELVILVFLYGFAGVPCLPCFEASLAGRVLSSMTLISVANESFFCELALGVHVLSLPFGVLVRFRGLTVDCDELDRAEVRDDCLVNGTAGSLEL